RAGVPLRIGLEPSQPGDLRPAHLLRPPPRETRGDPRPRVRGSARLGSAHGRSPQIRDPHRPRCGVLGPRARAGAGRGSDGAVHGAAGRLRGAHALPHRGAGRTPRPRRAARLRGRCGGARAAHPGARCGGGGAVAAPPARGRARPGGACPVARGGGALDGAAAAAGRPRARRRGARAVAPGRGAVVDAAGHGVRPRALCTARPAARRSRHRGDRVPRRERRPPPLRWDRSPARACDLRRRSPRMRIEFGWSLDGAAWAEGAGAHGIARMGPRTLVQLLQNRLGLTRPAGEPAVRVAQYLRLIEEHLTAASAPFWPARSFAVDPWSTARQLLHWRDAAVETGWDPAAAQGPLPERLAALRDLERAAEVGVTGTLAPCPADDLAEVIALLEGEAATWPLGIEELALHEDPQALPGMWPQLLALLDRSGVRCTI